MGSDPFGMLIMAALAIAAAGFVVYYLLRYLKGSITISLPEMAYNPGEAVEGTFELVTRREIRANNLTAALVATEVTRERGYNGRSHTHTREIYRAGQTLEHAKDFPAGYSAVYNFKIALPAQQGRSGGEGFLGQALDMISGMGRRVNWKVEVRLDAEGVDLAASQGISVNEGGIF